MIIANTFPALAPAIAQAEALAALPPCARCGMPSRTHASEGARVGQGYRGGKRVPCAGYVKPKGSLSKRTKRP